ncbi:MAG: caspase family protein, partial [Tumebacillaceae bacterium]
MHGDGILKKHNDFVYYGSFRRGLFHGFGAIEYTNGSKYFGFFEEGKRSGNGRFYDSGTHRTYEGDWLNDQKEGSGFETDAAGKVVAGYTWEKNKLCGQCFEVSPNGRIEGDYADGQVKVGTIMFNDGSIYTGECANGSPHGGGRLKYANGDEYIGRFIEGHRTGNGKYRWADGRIYDGYYYKDLRHGKGVIYNANNEKSEEGEWQDDELVNGYRKIVSDGFVEEYWGTFLNGNYHGDGRIDRSVDNCVIRRFSCRFFNGKPEGEASVVFEMTHDEYKGPVQNDQPHGWGKYSWSTGTTYEGGWSKGSAHGHGKLTYSEAIADKTNQEEYEGNFDAGKRHGQGQLRYRSGEIFSGLFMKGVRANEGQIGFPNGDVYEGALDNLVMHGKGRLTLIDGSVLDGTFKNNLFHGIGMQIGPETVGVPRTRTLGKWKNGELVKVHRSILRSGIVGGLHLNEKEENATVLFAEGDCYTGEIDSDNRPHTIVDGSIGIKYNKDGGMLQQGKWIRGRYQPRKLALVIGIAEYHFLAPLTCPETDADDVKSALESIGFHVDIQKNLKLTPLVDALHEFINGLSKGDTCFLYVSGHGELFGTFEYLLAADSTVEGNLKKGCGFGTDEILN